MEIFGSTSFHLHVERQWILIYFWRHAIANFLPLRNLWSWNLQFVGLLKHLFFHGESISSLKIKIVLCTGFALCKEINALLNQILCCLVRSFSKTMCFLNIYTHYHDSLLVVTVIWCANEHPLQMSLVNSFINSLDLWICRNNMPYTHNDFYLDEKSKSNITLIC
jgi:hypothetical protein